MESEERPACKTILRFIFPFWAITWGAIMCATGSMVYDLSPKTYAGLMFAPQWAWGAVSLVSGTSLLAVELSRSRALANAVSVIHCVFLAVLMLLFLEHSPMGAAFNVILTLFKAAHVAELGYRTGKR